MTCQTTEVSVSTDRTDYAYAKSLEAAELRQFLVL